MGWRIPGGAMGCIHDILVIALCTLLCGGETCTDMALFGRAKREFLESFLKLGNGIPSHDTFSRVFRLLNPESFHTWVEQFAQACRGVVALDGKTLRRSYDRAEGGSPLHLVSAWAVEQRLALGQLAVDGKSNEIVALPKLLRLLSLEGTVVTGCDALPTPGGPSGDGTVGRLRAGPQGHQGSLNDDVRFLLDDPTTPVAQATELSKGHGRIETRTGYAMMWNGLRRLMAAWLESGGQGRHPWDEQNGRTSVETRYYLMSQAFSPERFNDIVRSHYCDCIGPWTMKTKPGTGRDTRPGSATETGSKLGQTRTQPWVDAW